jgi:hypothetical protein
METDGDGGGGGLYDLRMHIECNIYVQKSMLRPGTIMINCTSGKGGHIAPSYVATRGTMYFGLINIERMNDN